MNLQNTPTISGGRKYYQGYDILKIILAILIVAAHTRLFIELPEIHYYFSIFCSCAIPSFFAVSSFLFIKRLDSAKNCKEEKHILYKTIKRLIIIFIAWN